MNYSIALYQTNSQHESHLYTKYIEKNNVTFYLENSVLWLEDMSKLFNSTINHLRMKPKLVVPVPDDYQGAVYTVRGYDLSALSSLTCVYNVEMDFPFKDPVMAIR